MAKFTITENQFIAAMAARMKPGQPWLPVLGLLLGVAGGVILATRQELAAIFPVLLIFFVILIPCYYLVKRKWRRLYRQTPAYGKPVEYSMDEDGCTITSPIGVERLTWAELYDVHSTEFYWFLHYNEAAYLILPVSALSEEESRILREVATRRCQRGAKAKANRDTAH